jgi:hypothetical protein
MLGVAMPSVVAPAPGGGAEAMPAGTAAAPAPGVPLWRCGAQTPAPMDVDAVDAPMANASTPAPMEVEAPVAFGTVATQGTATPAAAIQGLAAVPFFGSDASAAHGGAVAEPESGTAMTVDNTLAAPQAAPPASPSRAVAEPGTAITVEVDNKVEACPIPETSDEGRPRPHHPGRCPPSAPPASPSRGIVDEFLWGTWCKPTGAPWNRVGQGGGGQTN